MKHLVASCLLVAGCAERIGPPPNDNPDAPSGDASSDALVPTGKVTTVSHPDGSSSTLVDSTSMTEWTFVDIAAFAAADETAAWQLRFQRFHISTADGTEAVAVDAPFADVTSAPATGWLHDADTDGDGTIDYAFEQGDGWYDYDVATHVLSPRPLTWVVRSATATRKLRIDRYYDAAGTAGWFLLTWRPL